LLDITQQDAGNNGLVALAHQLIAAKLNIANGASSDCIQQVIDNADALIGDLVIPPVGDGFLDECIVDQDLQHLERYNKGLLCCASHCAVEGNDSNQTPSGCGTRPMTPEQMDARYRANFAPNKPHP
jgi:hypothetical protein